MPYSACSYLPTEMLSIFFDLQEGICTVLDSYNPNYIKQIAVQFVSCEFLLLCMNFKIVGLKA